MPDQDRFEKGFAPGWRKVYRLARGSVASDMEVSDACIAALAQCLRQAGGFPSLHEIAKIVYSIEQERQRLPLLEMPDEYNLANAFESLRQIERQYRGHRVIKVGVRAAMSLLVRLSREHGTHYTQAALTQQVAEETCLGLVDHHFFGRARPYLVGQRFSDVADAKAWEQVIKEIASRRIQKIAASLSGDPSATHLRAPQRTVPQRSTRDILDEPLTE